jgi:hypothetical protein
LDLTGLLLDGGEQLDGLGRNLLLGGGVEDVPVDKGMDALGGLLLPAGNQPVEVLEL